MVCRRASVTGVAFFDYLMWPFAEANAEGSLREQQGCQRPEQHVSFAEQTTDTAMSLDNYEQPVFVPQSRHV